MRGSRRRPPALAADDPRLPIVVAIGVGVGVLLLLIGAGLAVLQVSRSGWSRVDGVVTQVDTRTEKGDRFYRPTVEYVVDGRRYTVTSRSWSSEPVRVGQAVPVRYDPADPARGALGTLWLVSVVLASMGVLFVGLFWLAGWWTRRHGSGRRSWTWRR